MSYEHTRVTVRSCVFTFIGLVVLTAVTFGLSFLHLGAFEVPVSLGIAGVKAALVLLFFMELIEESVSSRLALASGVVLLAILIAFAVADIVTRTT